MCFVNIFTQSVVCLFILLAEYFTQWEFFILVKFRLSFSSLKNHTFGVLSKNSFQTQGHLYFLPCSINFIALNLHMDLYPFLS